MSPPAAAIALRPIEKAGPFLLRTLSRAARFRPSRRGTFAILACLLIVACAAPLLLRNSSLVEVREVEVRGLDGYYDRAARKAVAAEAGRMTTLNVDGDRLAAAAGQFVEVANVRVDRDLPHGLVVYVTVRRTVASVKVGGRIVAVTATGQVIEDATRLTQLPPVAVNGAVTGGRVADPDALAALRVLGDAPDLLLRRIKAVRWGRAGLILTLDKGVRLIFGNSHRAGAKWRAAVAVLASPASNGAAYVDLRVPERPAVGGLGPAPVTPKPPTAQEALPPDPSDVPPTAATGPTGVTQAPVTAPPAESAPPPVNAAPGAQTGAPAPRAGSAP